MRNIIVSLGMIFCVIHLSTARQSKLNGKRPNLLIVLSDQHSYDMVGAYGNQQVKTPNLDKFASEGVLFRNFFSNQPVCTPFRGMLLSGMHPLKNGAFVNDAPLLPNQSKLMGEILKDQGYQTAYIGKWHLFGGERDRPIPKGEMRYGFETLLTNNCHVDFRPGRAFFYNEEGKKEFFDEWEVYGQTKQALSFLDKIDKDKPFALIVSWHPPHDWGKFKGLDGKMHYRYDTMDELMAIYNRDSVRLRPGLDPSPDRKRMYHGYMAMVSGVDKAFGMLMKKLKDIGEDGNTLTVFSADHGDMLESHNATLPKQYAHDYSSRIPFIMKYPEKLISGSSTQLLMGTLDILPTVLGILGIDSGQEYDGKDLSKAIIQEEEEAVDSVPLWVYSKGGKNNFNWRGVVTKDYTFSMSMDSLKITNVLFDRQKDPFQLNNLFEDPDYKEEKERLIQLTHSWMNRFKDRFFGPNEFAAKKPIGNWENNYKVSPLELLCKPSAID